MVCERDTCKIGFEQTQKHQRFCSSKCRLATKISRNKERNKSFVLNKKAAGCMKCGEKDPACLDFHHRDPSTKISGGVNRLAQHGRKSLLVVEAEIEKCDVLCANCHRKLEYAKRHPF